MPRLMQTFQTQRERNDIEQQRLNREQQLKIAEMHYAPKPDTWESLNKDVHATSGASLGDWQIATNKRMEGDSIIAEVPGMAPPPGTPPEAAAYFTKPRTIKMPKTTFGQYIGRFNSLAGMVDAPNAATPPSGGPSVAPSAYPVTREPNGPAAAQSPLSVAPPVNVTASGPAPVRSKADYDALPDGTLYTAPDGSQRRKQRAQ